MGWPECGDGTGGRDLRATHVRLARDLLALLLGVNGLHVAAAKDANHTEADADAAENPATMGLV